MDTHTLPLIACAWRLFCEMPSSQGSRDGVGTPPRDRPLGRRSFFSQILCVFLRDSGTPISKAPKLLRKICAKICGTNLCIEHQKSVQKSVHKKSAQKDLRKNLCINQRNKISAKIVPKTGVKISVSLKDESQKKHRKNLRQICAKPQLQERTPKKPVETACERRKVNGGH